MKTPQRFLIYGVTGSGKSTFAAALSAKTGIPWTPVDDVCWDPGWSEVAVEEQRRRIGEIVAGDRWILDSAYGKWVDLVVPRVDLVLGLDYPRALSLARLVWRTVRRNVTGEPCCNGNRESWRLTLSRDSIVAWHFRSFSRKRERMRAWEAAGQPRILRFGHPREAEAWLTSLEPAVADGNGERPAFGEHDVAAHPRVGRRL